MKRIAILASMALSACTSLPLPVPTVTPAQVGAVGAELAAANLSPADYVSDAMLLNMWACNAYLLAQAQLNGNFGLAAQGTGLGTALATGLLGVTGAGAPAVALAGISGGGLASALGLAAGNTGIPYSAPTAEKVQEAMTAYAEAVWASPPATLAQAAMMAEGQRFLCTPSGITWLATQSISTATIGAAPIVNLAIVNGAERVVPVPGMPVITVNGRH